MSSVYCTCDDPNKYLKQINICSVIHRGAKVKTFLSQCLSLWRKLFLHVQIWNSASVCLEIKAIIKAFWAFLTFFFFFLLQCYYFEHNCTYRIESHYFLIYLVEQVVFMCTYLWRAPFSTRKWTSDNVLIRNPIKK